MLSMSRRAQGGAAVVSELGAARARGGAKVGQRSHHGRRLRWWWGGVAYRRRRSPADPATPNALGVWMEQQTVETGTLLPSRWQTVETIRRALMRLRNAGHLTSETVIELRTGEILFSRSTGTGFEVRAQ